MVKYEMRQFNTIIGPYGLRLLYVLQGNRKKYIAVLPDANRG